jgi:hypothetical protein
MIKFADNEIKTKKILFKELLKIFWKIIEKEDENR